MLFYLIIIPKFGNDFDPLLNIEIRCRKEIEMKIFISFSNFLLIYFYYNFLFFFFPQSPITLCNLGVGATFGESVLADLPRDSTVVTKTTCELLRVEQQDFRLIWEVI